MSRNYEEKLLQEIITGNYQLVYQSLGKYGNYSDTGVSKNLGLVKAQKREPSPFPFRGKRTENRSHNLGKLLGEGLGHKF